MTRLTLKTLNGTICTELGDLRVSFNSGSTFMIENKHKVIFEISSDDIVSQAERIPDTPESYLISGIMIWLKRVGHDYIFELAKLTMDKKLEEIQAVPVEKKPRAVTKKPKPKAAVSPLRGKLIVFSGFRDNMMERLIVQKGGIIANSVGYNTDYLVIPDELRRDITTKINKANRFGVEIKRRSQFLVLINS
jgi:NAD-dependent DNA ligase